MAKKTAAQQETKPAPSKLPGIKLTALGEPDYRQYFNDFKRGGLSKLTNDDFSRDLDIAMREVLVRLLDLYEEHSNTVWPLAEFVHNVAFQAVLHSLAVTPELIEEDSRQFRSWFEDLKEGHKVYDAIYLEEERRLAHHREQEAAKNAPQLVKPTAAKRKRKAA